jgi:HAD superfamily hydrolase (TIGR01662 family)
MFIRRVSGDFPSMVLAGVLFDRDGTLIDDVPYNGDPMAVRLRPTAWAAVRLARWAGLAIGVVSNQSGVARGLLTEAQVRSVNDEVRRQLCDPIDVWRYCTHAPGEGCRCRKPAPGMIVDAAAELGLAPEQLAVIGDIGADVVAATAAGARPILVPTAATRAEEVRAAPTVAPTLLSAIRLLLCSDRDDA